MKLVPAHRISYKGTFYRVGDIVEVDDADADEMRKYGKIIFEDFTERDTESAVRRSEEIADDDIPVNFVANNTPPTRRGGRPRKV